MPEKISHLIVIGGSAGGVDALLRLVPRLPENLQAAVCIVVHTGPRAKSMLPKLLNRAGKLPAKYAEDGEELRDSQIYIAPADFHMVIDGTSLRLIQGPKENMTRPAIDPLFRSAAQTYDGAVIGVVLSGMLDDGTAGLGEIKRAGGMAIVQDPEETSFTGMPHNAIEHVDVDFILPVDQIASRLVEMCTNGNGRLVRGHAENQTPEHAVERYICPECGGALKEEDRNNTIQFRCHVGHGFSVESLIDAQSGNVEKVLWSAVRALRERADLAQKLAIRFRNKNASSSLAKRYENQAVTALAEADQIVSIISRRELIDDTGGAVPV